MEEITLENLANRIETDTKTFDFDKKRNSTTTSCHNHWVDQQIQYASLRKPQDALKKNSKTNEMIKELYRMDENGKYVHSLLERNSCYGITGEFH